MEGIYENSGVFLLIAAICIAAELLWRKVRGQSYDYGALGSTLFIFAGQVLSSAAYTALILAVWMAAYEISPFQWSMSDWRVWVAAFILMEFTYYWQHRFSHTVRWMWATHAVHHSPNEFVLPAAFRLGWTGAISGSWLIHLPVALLGFHPAMMGAILLVGLRYQFFLHTEKIGRLGPIDWLFNTPSNHRVHHSSEADFLDKNYGNVLMVFDHMFGSYAAERPGQTHRYGLTDPFTSNNPLHIVSREWVRLIQDVIASRTPASAFKAAFGRPTPTPVKPPRASLQLDREVDRHVV